MRKIFQIIFIIIGVYLLLLIIPVSSLDKKMGGNYNNLYQLTFINDFFGTITSSANLDD